MQLDFEVDELTHPFEDVQIGESYATEVLPLSRDDMKLILKKDGWQFDWGIELENTQKSVFKLAIIKEPEGVDFVVEPHVLTDEDRRIIAEHIRAHKAKQTQEEKNIIGPLLMEFLRFGLFVDAKIP